MRQRKSLETDRIHSSKAPTRVPTCVECHACEAEIHDVVIRLRSSGAPLRWPLCVECMQVYEVIEDYGVVE